MKGIVTPAPNAGQEKKIESHALNVFDDEKNEWVEISQDTQKYAGFVHQQTIVGSLITAMAIKKIKDDKLYLALGCGNFEEYVSTMLPIGRRTAYNYLKIGNKMELAFPKQLEEGKDDVQLNAHKIEGLNITNLLELTALEDKDFKKLLNDGKIEINGENFDIEDFKDMTARQTASEIKKTKSKYSNKVDTLSESVKMLKDEKKTLENRIDENEQTVKAAQEKEKLYGAAASNYEHKQSLLNDAKESLYQFEKLLSNADVKTEDSANLQKEFVDLVKRISEVHETFCTNFEDVISQF